MSRQRHFTDVLKWQECPLDPGIERASFVAELGKMADKKSAEPSPESMARAERQRLASQEGAQAMADIERSAIAIRKNMERLRALREAKEAEEAKTQGAANEKRCSEKGESRTVSSHNDLSL